MSPEERHDRLLLLFARWHDACLDADDATRESIAALCRRLVRGSMDRQDTRSTLGELDDLLMGEIARRHR